MPRVFWGTVYTFGQLCIPGVGAKDPSRFMWLPSFLESPYNPLADPESRAGPCGGAQEGKGALEMSGSFRSALFPSFRGKH